MSKQVTASTPSIGFGGALTILFIALKLTHVIDWSWVWVLSPIWITIGLVVLVILAVILFAVIGALVSSKPSKRNTYRNKK